MEGEKKKKINRLPSCSVVKIDLFVLPHGLAILDLNAGELWK